MKMKTEDADYQCTTKLHQNNALLSQVLKRVAVFRVSLKLVREKVRAQLSNKDNKHLTSNGSKCLHKGGIVNKNDTLI